MLAGTLQTGITRRIAVRQRRERMCPSALRLLRVVTTKHAIEEAARFAGRPPSLFANLVPSPSQVASTTLAHRSTTPARQFAKARPRVNGRPWPRLIVLDRTRPHRASLHPANTQTFHHGKG